MLIGSNPCTCSEVVVKAAKLPKPTYYVSPQEIKDAATVKNMADTSQSDCSSSQNADKATAYSDKESSSNSNTCGCSGSSQKAHSNSNSNKQSKSSSVTYSDSSSAGCSGSSVDYTTKSKSDCNCKKQNIETLDIEDHPNSNGNIVPRYLFFFSFSNKWCSMKIKLFIKLEIT